MSSPANNLKPGDSPNEDTDASPDYKSKLDEVAYQARNPSPPNQNNKNDTTGTAAVVEKGNLSTTLELLEITDTKSGPIHTRYRQGAGKAG